MATTAALATVDRAFGDAIVVWTVANVDGDQSLFLGLPAGFGECALMEASASVASIATMQVAFESSGVMFQLFDPAEANVQDMAFGERWHLVAAGQVVSRASPDQVQFWGAADTLRLRFAEIDINATPTGDLTVVAKVRRMRPLRVMA